MYRRLENAIEKNDSQTVQKLLQDPGMNPGAFNNRAIYRSAVLGYPAIVRLLLADPRVDPATDHNKAIHNAVEHGRIEVVQLLLEDDRTDPGDKDNEAIRIAAAYANDVRFPEALRLKFFKIVKLLAVDPRVDPTVNDNELIRTAIAKNQTDRVRFLFAIPEVAISIIGYYLNSQQEYQLQTLALMTGAESKDPVDLLAWAAAIGSLPLVQYLVEEQKVNPAANHNQALFKAISHDQSNVVNFLFPLPGVALPAIEFLLVFHIKNISKLAIMTGALSENINDILTWAAAVGSLPLVQSLIEEGADPTFYNNSPIHAAGKNGRVEVVNYLLTLPGVHF